LPFIYIYIYIYRFKVIFILGHAYFIQPSTLGLRRHFGSPKMSVKKTSIIAVMPKPRALLSSFLDFKR